MTTKTRLFSFLSIFVAFACGSDPIVDPPWHGDVDAITYRDDLTAHPGCTTAPSDIRSLEYTPAQIPGYTCAAKEYTFPAGVTEDTSKPIALLVHGNSDGPTSWEKCVDGVQGTATCAHHESMLAELLVAAGVRTFAVDMRYDMACDKAGGPDACNDNDEENLARNIDHGWGVPITQHFIRSLMETYPNRRFSIAAHSFGVTATRDALRRLQLNEGFNPWPQLDTLILGAGANHGVSSYALCATNPTMRGQVTCEMGSRDNYQQTPFHQKLNGPNRAWETPCSDGLTAYDEDVCEGNAVNYITLVMEDRPDGTYKDEFVSQVSAGLKGATNRKVGLDAIDTSAYFFGSYSQDGLGLFKSHFGAIRSAAALGEISPNLRD